MKNKARRLAGIGLTTSLSIILFISLRADAFELVADLNYGSPARATYAGRGLDVPQGTFLPLVEYSHGTELWFTDNTAQGTRLVRDIFPGWVGSHPSWYSKLGDVVVFIANDGVHGTELWRTDGTAPGTFMLADIGPGAQHYGGAYPTVVLNEVLYFTADDTVTGNELWRTDGTREGTYLVADIVPGYEGSYVRDLTPAANNIIFVRTGEIWISDGTGPGTRKIADLGVSRCCELVGDAVFFTANDGVHGLELWRADVDGNNVHMVANLNNEPTGSGQDGWSNPEFAFKRGNSLIFTAKIPLATPVNGTASDCKLFRADASGAGVTELMNFEARCYVSKVINLPAGTMFNLSPSGVGDSDELWISDGTPAGTMPLDLGLSYSTKISSESFKAAYGQNGEAYFFGRSGAGGQLTPPDKIWRTDGTRAGTRVFADLTTYSTSQEIAYLDGRLYFDAGATPSHSAGNELWTSDGTAAGTFLVRDITLGSAGSTFTDLRVANGRLQFFAGALEVQNLWSSDGTLDGTVNLSAGSVQSGTGDSNVVFAGQLGARAVFAADRGSDSGGRELNITDGTTAGTTRIRDINEGGSADPENFLVMNDQILFVARDFSHGRELWRTDGTSGGTIQLADIVNTGDGNVTLGGPSSILDGVAYFTGGTITSPRLWRTDGTVAGTFEVTGNVGARVIVLGGTGTHLLYQAFANGSMHLWSWNGSSAQIITVADGLKIASTPGVNLDGRVCFRAWDVSPQRLDIWCANGQPGDLVRATNFDALGLTAADLRALGDKLLVNARGSGAAAGLYTTQGAAAGMQRISGERVVSAKEFGGGQLVFASESGGLMLTDGTSTGTRSLLQGVTLPGGFTGDFGVLSNYVVFVVDDPTLGAVLWRTDGTAAGTRYVADVDSGTASPRSASQFFTLGDRLLFSASRTGIGHELWSINATDPNASPDVASVTAGTAATIDVLDNDSDFDGTLNAGSVSIVTNPVNGSATVNPATGAITYTANATYSGSDSLRYRVADDQGRQSNIATLTIQVAPGSVVNPPAPPPPPAPPATPPSTGGGGGGGALGIELWWLLVLAALKAAWGVKRRGCRMEAPLR